jgi:hypothetical protein
LERVDPGAVPAAGVGEADLGPFFDHGLLKLGLERRSGGSALEAGARLVASRSIFLEPS